MTAKRVTRRDLSIYIKPTVFFIQYPMECKKKSYKLPLKKYCFWSTKLTVIIVYIRKII